jgi:hypothetical protein
MKKLKYTMILILIPLLFFGQEKSDSILKTDNEILVYVFSKSKITLNGEKISIPKLDKYLRWNQVQNAKIGTLKPTPIKVFPTFEKVVKLMKKYKVKAEWYSDPEFQKPFFDD